MKILFVMSQFILLPKLRSALRGVFTRGIVSIALLFSLNAAANGVLVVDPGQLVAGQSQLSLAEKWTQWALGIPASTNPIADPDGAFGNINNNGSVFFLAGTFSGSATRTITAPSGKSIFFPILNAFDVEWPSGTHTESGYTTCFDPPGTSEAEALACAKTLLATYQIGDASGLYARLGGVDLLTDFTNFRQTSTAFFDVTLPEDDIFGLGAGNDLKGITDGYWLALEGLAPGAYTLTFGGRFNYADGTSNLLDMTVNLNVVPEPPILLLLLSTMFAMTTVKRRKG